MSAPVPSAAEARRQLRAAAEPGRAENLAWFFKTGPGGYGEGDRFHGVRVPAVRRVARALRDLSLPEVKKLLRSAFHEERLLGLFLLVHRFEKGDASERSSIVTTYLDNLDRVDNWDLVDASAPRILGAHLRERRDRRILYRLAASTVLWERRIAMIATLAFIQEGDVEDALAIAEELLDDDEDLIHKAAGWMLREVGKRDAARLEAFLTRHHVHMPRTMLRYAIERLSPRKRARFMKRPAKGARGGRKPSRRSRA
jgi:3-methyladenine DNA glycosylase AlkD